MRLCVCTLLWLVLDLQLLASSAPLPPDACKLPFASSRSDVGLGFPRIPNRLKTLGGVNFSLVFLDFSDAPYDKSPEEFVAFLSPALELYRSLSYGRMQPIFSPLLTTLRMGKPSTAYSFSTFEAQRAYLQEAAGLAVGAGADFSLADAILAIATPKALGFGPAFCATPGWGFNVSGKSFDNAATSGRDLLGWGSKWFNHEVGHAMSLVDLYSFVGGPQFQYTGSWSLMGDIAGAGCEFFAWERFQLGWLEDAHVACAASGTSTLSLSALEAPPGGAQDTKLLLARTGRTTAIAVEVREALGYDTSIPQPGLLMYYLDTSLETGDGPLRVLPWDSKDNVKLHATLATPGASIAQEGVNVTLLTPPATQGAPWVLSVTVPCSTWTCPGGTCSQGVCTPGTGN